MRVTIAGIGGFLGSHIAEAWRAQGATVQGLDRSLQPDRAEALECEILIHAARCDALHTEAILRAARQFRVGQIVHISSIAAKAPVNPYGRHKVEEEALVSHIGIPASILRFPAVYGPRMRGLPLRLAKWTLGRLPVPRGWGRRSVLYAKNAAAATIAAASCTGTFEVDEGTTLTAAEYAQLIAAAAGRHPTIFPRVEFVERLLLATPLFRARIIDITADGSRFEIETGYRPVVSRDVAFLETVQWLTSALG